jgi:short-subunit dehydrogenase
MKFTPSTAFTAAGAAALAWGLSRWTTARALDEFEGQTVLITGGTRGLGLCLARELAARNCRVAICARSEDELTSAAIELQHSGADQVLPLVCDVTSPDQVQEMTETVRREFGPVQTLINNAGTIVVGPLEKMSLDEFRLCMDTMFWGTVYPTMAVLPDMMNAARGNIMNITSIGGRVTVPHLVPYCCAKSAAVAFSEGLRMEVKPYGIHVLTAVPGLMRTGGHENALIKGQHEKEYSWFALASSAPGITMDASRAARQLLDALAKNKGEHHVTLAADLLSRVHGLMPGMVNELAGAAGTLLPSPARSTEVARGEEVQKDLPEWVDRLTALGKKASEEYQLHRV